MCCFFFVVFAFDNTDGDNNANADRCNHQRSLFPRVNNITIITCSLMAEIFMTNQLITESKTMMRLEKFQQNNVMIIRLDICYVLVFPKSIIIVGRK